MSRQHLHQLMSEVGPLLDLDEVIEYPEQGLWILAFADGATLDVEYDEAVGGRILIAMDIGEPAVGDDAALYRMLLQYNSLWRQTGGVRMALAGKSVVQTLELASAGLELPTLAAALAGLHENAAPWRTLLTATPSAAEDASALPPSAHTLRA